MDDHLIAWSVDVSRNCSDESRSIRGKRETTDESLLSCLNNVMDQFTCRSIPNPNQLPVVHHFVARGQLLSIWTVCQGMSVTRRRGQVKRLDDVAWSWPGPDVDIGALYHETHCQLHGVIAERQC